MLSTFVFVFLGIHSNVLLKYLILLFVNTLNLSATCVSDNTAIAGVEMAKALEEDPATFFEALEHYRTRELVRKRLSAKMCNIARRSPKKNRRRIDSD